MSMLMSMLTLKHDPQLVESGRKIDKPRQAVCLDCIIFVVDVLDVT